MAIAQSVPPKSTNTSKTKRSVSSAVQAATVIALTAPLASTVTGTVVTNAFGAVPLQRVIAPQVRAVFTRNNSLNFIGLKDEKTICVSNRSLSF